MILTLKELSLAERAKRRLKFPNVPENVLSYQKYTDKTANGLTKCIKTWFDLQPNAQAERISVMGRMVDCRKTFIDIVGRQRVIGNTQYIPSSMKKGSSDLSCLYNGMTIKIEIKIGRDRQSDNQKKYQADIERAGGKYWIVTSWDDFITKIQTLCSNSSS
jgi:hypothetical protein